MASITDQNWIVWNQGKNPLVNFNFMLRVELLFDLPCKSVRAFSRELEYDYIQEGGLNDYVHMRRKPITRPFTLEIERYVGVDYIDPLPLGADLVLPVLLFVSRNHDQFIPGVVARTYVFTGCTVMKKTYGDLVADQSGLLVETTTLGYREMLCVDIPWSEVGDNISKDIKTAPTNARSIDKTSEELKVLGQQLYDQALEARDKANEEFAQGDVEALLEDLEETLTSLRAATGPGGSLTKQLDTAKRNINGEGGKTKKKIADEAMDAARLAQQEARKNELAWKEKDNAWRKAKDAVSALQSQMKAPSEKVKDLDAQLKKIQEDKTALENQLPADVRTEEGAKTALEAAQKAYDEAEDELKKAKESLQKAIAENEDDPQVKAAREKADGTATELASKQAEADEADKVLAEAQKVHQAALRAWQEEQDEELERAAVKRKSCEDQVRARQKDVRQLEKDTEAQQKAADALEKEQEQAADALEKAKQALEATEEQAAAGNTETADELEKRRQDAEKALEEAQENYNKVENELKKTQEQLAEETEKAKKQADALKQAEKVLADASAEEKALADKIAKGPQDNDEIEELRQETESAKADLDAARKELDTAQKADDAAQAELQELRKKLEKPILDGEAGKRVESAAESRNEAKKELDAAEVHAKACAELAALASDIEKLQAEKKEAEAAVQAAGGDRLKDAQTLEDNTKKEADQAKSAHETAVGKWKDAAAKAETARDAAEQADQMLARAQTDFDRGKKQINPLQNSLINMKKRKDTGTQAQTDCKEQHDRCKDANSALQALSDEDLLQINAGYEKVKKLAKQTCYHEQQVREVCQHMEAARKLLSEVVEIPASETAEEA